jgi:hypothetical protein
MNPPRAGGHTYVCAWRQKMSFFQYRTVTISTTVPRIFYDEAKKRGWKHNDLWRLGYEAKNGGSPLLERVQLLEKSKEEVYKLLLVARKRISQLEQKEARE